MQIHSSIPWRKRRGVRRVLATLLVAIATALVAAPLVASWAVRRAQGELRARLSVLLAHPVDFAAVRVRPTGVELDGVTVRRAAGESADPAHIERVRVALDWWRLIRTRTVRVRAIELDGATIRVERVPQARPGQPTWTTQVLALGATGLAHVGITRGSIDAPGIALRDVDGAIAIGRDRIALTARASSVALGGIVLSQPSVVLAATRDAVRIERASAGFEGGSLRAQGELEPGFARGELTLSARGLRVERVLRDAGLATRIPARITGEADVQARVRVRDGALEHAAATVAIAHGVVGRDGATLAFDTARVRGEWSPERTTIASLELTATGLATELRGQLDAATFSASGRVTVERAGLVALGRVLPLPRGLAARRAQFDVEIAGPIASPEHATGTVRARVDELRVATRGAPIELARLEATVVRAPTSLVFHGVVAQVRGASAAGDVAFTGRRFGALDRYEAHAHVAVRDLVALDAFLPAAQSAWLHREVAPWSPRAVADVLVQATGSTRPGAPLALDGRFALDDFRVGDRADQPAGVDVFPLAVTHAEGAFRVHGSSGRDDLAASVDALTVQTAGVGTFTGRAEVAPGGVFSARLEGHGVDPSVVRGLIPGVVTGGRGEGTLALEGSLVNGTAPVLHGHFVVTDARYELPRALPLAPGPLAVARFEGDYRVEARHASLTALSLRADLLTATRGAIDVTPAGVRLTADLATDDAGRVASSFAPLAGVFRAGSAAGQLALAIDPRGVARGSLRVQTRGGSLTLPSVDASFATHPIDAGRVWLGFAPERFTFADLAIRGPRGNLDAAGSVSQAGAIAVRGHAWLTPDATTALLRPTHVGWLAWLVGVRQVASDFTLTGDARGATLHAAIVNTALWQLAGPFIPSDVRNVARGRTRIVVAG